MANKFAPQSEFAGDSDYRLLPFNVNYIDRLGTYVAVSVSGEYILLRDAELTALVRHQFTSHSPLFHDLIAKHFIYRPNEPPQVPQIAAQLRTKRAFAFSGPSLHIIVVSLRCDHSCQYCQVSRQSTASSGYDLGMHHLPNIIDRIFESSAPSLTVEFQGGEPLLAFERIAGAIGLIEARNRVEKRDIQYVVTTTTHLLTDEMLDFFADHNVYLSTSLDGPDWIHNANRPNNTRNSYAQTIAGIERARAALGHERVNALATITRKSLAHPKDIVDEYARLGMSYVALRPLSHYGFAKKGLDRLSYSMGEFLAFYHTALDYIIELNLAGTYLEEAMFSLLLRNALTPFAHGYVDLRSPMGAGLGALVYNYDGYVYPSDESRMLVEMGDTSLRLGDVSQPLAELLTSDAMRTLAEGGLTECIPKCSRCAYQSYCGTDPVQKYAREPSTFALSPSADFCMRQLSLFERLVSELSTDRFLPVANSWISRRSIT